MVITPSTPALRVSRLLGEGARILAAHPGQPDIDITHDITALLETFHDDRASSEPDEKAETAVA